MGLTITVLWGFGLGLPERSRSGPGEGDSILDTQLERCWGMGGGKREGRGRLSLAYYTAYPDSGSQGRACSFWASLPHPLKNLLCLLSPNDQSGLRGCVEPQCPVLFGGLRVWDGLEGCLEALK
jgi:hypothetical protein